MMYKKKNIYLSTICLIIQRKGLPWHSNRGRLTAFESHPRLRFVPWYICPCRPFVPAFCPYFLERQSCRWSTFYQFNRLILASLRVQLIFERKEAFCWSIMIFTLKVSLDFLVLCWSFLILPIKVTPSVDPSDVLPPFSSLRLARKVFQGHYRWCFELL